MVKKPIARSLIAVATVAGILMMLAILDTLLPKRMSRAPETYTRVKL